MWGVSSSGYQCEGDQGQKIDSNFQRSVDNNTTTQPYYAYRIGIQWSRLEPKQGEFNITAIAVYKDILLTMRKAGMTPIVTLDHWTFPGWMLDLGGWASELTVTNWLTNMKVFIDAVYATSDDIALDPWWISINEAQFYGVIEVSLNDITPAEIPIMFERMVECHRSIYDNVAYVPNGVNPGFDALFLDKIADKIDWLGIDQYYGSTPSDPGANAHSVDSTTYMALIEAEGIYYVLFVHLKLT
ncbi:hypothetical protein RQP46_009039 [Phenoliferia psychrophenolica]